jgi:hypothetical protein
LTYTSIAKPDLNDQDISDILETARTHNAQVGITGCLLFHKGIFVQVLEGKERDVSRLYQKIIKDTRHSNVLTVDEYFKQERSFENWSMAYKSIEDKELENIAGAMSFKDFDSLADFSTAPASSIRSFWTMAKQLRYF